MEEIVEQKQVVIRRPLLGNILFAMICAAFVAGSIFLLNDDGGDPATRIVAIVAIIFFGIGGLAYLVFMARKPIVIVTDKGITVPHGRGKTFVPWENIQKFEVLELHVKGTTNKCIGVFVRDAQDMVVAGNLSKLISKSVTGWSEVPELLINPSFTFIKIEKIMDILQSFLQAHNNQTM
jgi:chorismate mutase